jgi:uncharacterized repeat protein (TIGR03803 family)
MLHNRSLWTLGAVLLVITMAAVPDAWTQSKYKTLYKFTGGADGGGSFAGLIFDTTGSLYGTTVYGGAYQQGSVFKLTPNSDGTWAESVLYSFRGDKDGSQPNGVILDDAENLYGTTYAGGAAGSGTIFELTPNTDGSWTESLLYDFCSLTKCTDGASPMSSLILDNGGNLYGTTLGGSEGGVAFKLTRLQDGNWTESVLHSFPSRDGDGINPNAALIFDSAGSLYGTTVFGGTHDEGTVYKLKPNSDGSWAESVLYSFSGGKDGGYVDAGLVFDPTGNLYGATVFGGDLSQCGTSGCGVVFELTPKAGRNWAEKVLHDFNSNRRDGLNPEAGVIFDAAGDLYGTTVDGGDRSRCINSGCGIVFKLAPNSKGGWKETVLHTFFDRPGANPYAGVIVDQVGNLYGTTAGDGSTSFGSVFEITP